jgi:hypothetical protein
MVSVAPPLCVTTSGIADLFDFQLRVTYFTVIVPVISAG